MIVVSVAFHNVLASDKSLYSGSAAPNALQLQLWQSYTENGLIEFLKANNTNLHILQ